MNFAEKLKYKADINDLNITVNKEMCYVEKRMEEHFDKREFRINLLVPERTMAIGQNYTNMTEFFVPLGVSPAHYRQLFMDELFKLGFKGTDIELDESEVKGYYKSYSIIVRW